MQSPQLSHETYWQSENSIGFTDYERNLALPSFFNNRELVLDLGCGELEVCRCFLVWV